MSLKVFREWRSCEFSDTEIVERQEFNMIQYKQFSAGIKLKFPNDKCDRFRAYPHVYAMLKMKLVLNIPVVDYSRYSTHNTIKRKKLVLRSWYYLSSDRRIEHRWIWRLQVFQCWQRLSTKGDFSQPHSKPPVLFDFWHKSIMAYIDLFP